METALATSSATLCIVFVQSSTTSAPADSSPRASAASSAPASSQRPSTCMRSTSAKSTEASTICAEWRPPSASLTPSLSRR